MSRPRYGAPDGFGRHGILDVDAGGKLVCHECGHTFDHLSTHTAGAHGIRAGEYRERHGLSTGTPLVSKAVQERMREAWARNERLHKAALEASRDPARAQAGNRPGSRWRPELVARRIQQGKDRRRDLTPAQTAALGDVTDIPGWADRARRLIADEGVSTYAIARAVGLSQGAVTGRLRRYPARDRQEAGQ